MANATVWTEKTFEDNKTVIDAAFLNGFQRNVIAAEGVVNGKVDKVTGKALSTNDFTTALKNKLDALPTKATLDTSLAGKVDKVEGKGLSTNDYTDADKQKVDVVDTKAPVILNTASGDIASFSDGADSMPIKSLVATIEPVQDLHGYDHPWPAGGGKNLYDIIGNPIEQGAISSSSGSKASADTRVRTGKAVKVTPGATYTISTNALYVYAHFYTEETIGSSTWVSSGNAWLENPATVTIPNDASYVAFALTNDTRSGTAAEAIAPADIEYIQLEEGSTATDYVPYSNICPITGWTGLTGARAGKNLFDEANATWVTGKFINADGNEQENSAYKYSSKYYPVSGFSFLTVEITRTATNSVAVSLPFYNKDKQFVGREVAIQGTSAVGVISGTVPVPEDAFYFRINMANSSNVTDVYVEAGAADDGYIPYTGTPISVNWQSTAGEVFGGTVDIVSGKMRVTWGSFDIGVVAWNNDTSNHRFFRQVPGLKLTTGPRRTRLLCPVYQSIHDGRSLGNTPDFSIYGAGTSEAIYIQESRYGTVAEFQEANQGNIVVYPLAEPIEYQLTPQEITTLLGTNHVWADVGPVEVTYPADTKLFIEKLTQPTEDDMTADHAIASGTFFQLGNTLYLATAAIAAGATITPGTNATKLSLADALNQLNT